MANTAPKGITAEQIITAIDNNYGNLSAAARELGIQRYPLQVRVTNNPEIKEALNNARDKFIDLAEEGLYAHVKAKSLAAITFLLKTIGKERGWGESQNINLVSKNLNANVDLSKLSTEELVQLEYLINKSSNQDSD